LEPAWPLHLRERRTSTDEMEPAVDPKGDDPRRDLCFHASPIFLKVK
jgi:hypothetical protein